MDCLWSSVLIFTVDLSLDLRRLKNLLIVNIQCPKSTNEQTVAASGDISEKGFKDLFTITLAPFVSEWIKMAIAQIGLDADKTALLMHSDGRKGFNVFQPL